MDYNLHQFVEFLNLVRQLPRFRAELAAGSYDAILIELQFIARAKLANALWEER